MSVKKKWKNEICGTGKREKPREPHGVTERRTRNLIGRRWTINPLAIIYIYIYWFLSLQWKTCLWAELQPWCLNLQWKTCPWAEHTDEMKWNRWVGRNGGMELVSKENMRKPEETYPDFVSHTTKPTWSNRDANSSPAMGGDACTTKPAILYAIQEGREISAIIVTEDYLCYKEPKSPYNFFLF